MIHPSMLGARWLTVWKRRLGTVLAVVLVATVWAAPSHAVEPDHVAAACETAIHRAEVKYHLPPGLLLAIGLAESARLDPATRRFRPWPWAVQSNDRSYYFETKALAVAWVLDTQANGVASIDTGCLQVNLYFHPQAFATLDMAFDPDSNVDYAARFLLRLHDETSDWGQAIGLYHSRTPALAAPYQQRVQLTMGASFPGAVMAPPKPPSLVAQLALAWRAGGAPAAPPPHRLEGNDWTSLLHPARSTVFAAATPQASLRPPLPRGPT